MSAAFRSRARSACSAAWRPAAAKRRTVTAFEGTLAHDQLLTDPEDAVRFVRETEVDALAVAMGTSHGAYKFTRQPGRRGAGDGRDRGNPPPAAEHPSGDARLVVGAGGAAGDHQPVRRRDEARPGACRSRRSSAASSTACARSTSTPTTAWRSPAAIRKVLAENPGEFDPRKYLKPAMDAMTKLCDQRLRGVRHRSGHAAKIRAMPLSEMAKRYKDGSLDPKIG